MIYQITYEIRDRGPHTVLVSTKKGGTNFYDAIWKAFRKYPPKYRSIVRVEDTAGRLIHEGEVSRIEQEAGPFLASKTGQTQPFRHAPRLGKVLRRNPCGTTPRANPPRFRVAVERDGQWLKLRDLARFIPGTSPAKAIQKWIDQGAPLKRGDVVFLWKGDQGIGRWLVAEIAGRRGVVRNPPKKRKKQAPAPARKKRSAPRPKLTTRTTTSTTTTRTTTSNPRKLTTRVYVGEVQGPDYKPIKWTAEKKHAFEFQAAHDLIVGLHKHVPEAAKLKMDGRIMTVYPRSRPADRYQWKIEAFRDVLNLGGGRREKVISMTLGPRINPSTRAKRRRRR